MLKAIKKIAVLFWYFVASIIILIAVIGVSFESLTPVLNKHKASIEHYASDFLHMEVHVQSIQADWARFGPEIRVKGLTLSEIEHHRLIIQADELVAHVGIFRTIWRRSVFFRSLQLAGTDLSIREVAPQQYLLNNSFVINLADQTTSMGAEIFQWFISQNHIRLTRIHAELLRLNEANVAAQLEQVNIYQSPTSLSAFVEGSIQGRIPKQAHEFRAFKTHVLLSAWAGISPQHKITFAEVELLDRDLLLQDGEINRHYPRLEGIFLWQPVGKNWLLQAKEVTLSKMQKKSSDLSFELWQRSEDYAAHINAINLADIAVFADFLNLTPKDMNLAAAHIQGNVEDIDLIIPKDFSAVKQYQFSGVLREVSSAAYGEVPEMHHLSGAVSGSVAQGDFILSDNNDEVYFAKYFNQPVVEKVLTASGQWLFANKKLSLLFSAMHLSSSKIEASARMRLDIPLEEGASPTSLALLAGYDLKQSHEALNILPMKLFNADFGKWLSAAIGPGLGSEGKVLIRGNIEGFPYVKKEGTFIVDGSIKPVALLFSPDWPAVDNVSGHLLLHNQMFSTNVTGLAQGVALTQAAIKVADYTKDDAMINVDLQAVGKAADYLNYIHLSPLDASVGEALRPFDFSGRGVLSLHLGLPLNHLDADHIIVTGQWLAQGVRFFWQEINLGLDNMRGAINFTKNSLSADHMDAMLKQEPLQLSIHSETEKNLMSALDFDVLGTLSVDQLKAISKINWLSLYLTGRASYHAHLFVPMTTTPTYLFSLDTQAKGMRVNLPGLLGKTEQSSSPMSFNLSITPSADLARLAINYQKNISATADIQHYSQVKNKQKTIQINAHALQFTWPLDIQLPATSPASDTSSLWASITAINLAIDHLSLYQNDFSRVSFIGARQPASFFWKMQANEARGNINLPSNLKQPIAVNFDYLTLHAASNVQKNKTTTTAAAATSFSAQKASAWPPLLINIQRFIMGKQNFGAVILQTAPLDHGVGFNKIDISNNVYHVAAQGQWVGNGAQDVTSLNGTFMTKNLGDFLSQSGITQEFQAKASNVNFMLNWLGSPMSFQLKTLEGDAAINVKDGVIPLDGDAAKMGLGKVLSLFSTQSIQRRLQLNFSDLGTNGYSFNTLMSKLHFHAGNANVQQGAFDGPTARIGFTGRVGLVKQDYDLYLVVTPYVTSTLPILATIAGGPIAGVATYAFDKIASSSIDKLTSYKYLLLGSWSKPKLISLDLEKEKKPEEKNIAPVEEAAR